MKNKELILSAILLELIFILTLIYIKANTDLAIQTREFVSLENQIDTIKETNLRLEDRILTYQSFLYINQQAQKMGFVPQSGNVVIYLIN